MEKRRKSVLIKHTTNLKCLWDIQVEISIWIVGGAILEFRDVEDTSTAYSWEPSAYRRHLNPSKSMMSSRERTQEKERTRTDYWGLWKTGQTATSNHTRLVKVIFLRGKSSFEYRHCSRYSGSPLLVTVMVNALKFNRVKYWAPALDYRTFQLSDWESITSSLGSQWHLFNRMWVRPVLPFPCLRVIMH